MLKQMQQNPNLRFVCDRCDANPPKLPENREDKLSLAIDKLTAALTSFEQRMNTIEAKVQSIAESVPTKQQVIDLVQETVERRENRNQLVVCGIPETERSDAGVINGMFGALGVVDCPPAEVYRLGRPNSARPQGKPRLIKVRFGRSWQRDQVLAKASGLKGNGSYPGVYIRPSHTTNERRQIALLYDEKKMLEQDGNTYFIDRRGPVDNWELVRSERKPPINRPADDEDEWQTVQSHRHPRASSIFVPPNDSIQVAQ